MKKVTSLFMGLVILATASFAQPKMVTKKADKKVTSETKVTAPAEMAAPAAKMSPAEKQKIASSTKQTPVIKMVPKSNAVGAPLKKDGTPDKRFKAGKGAKAEGPVKKDGTPDMRFKKNKASDKKAA